MKTQATALPIQDYLTMPEVQQLLQDIALPDENVQQWLGNLALLNNIPFQNIIADTRLAPPESLRFFYLDPSWIDAVMDGALSVGSDTSLDSMFTEVMAAVVKAAGVTIANQIRQGLINIEPENGKGILPDPNNLLSGLLFRSQIVADWPGLQIIPTYPDSTVSQVPLRFEQIGPDIILIIFPAIPTSIIVRQPAHALAFGVEDGANTGDYNIYLRSVWGSATGQQITSSNEPVLLDITTTGNAFRAGGNNVLDINSLVSQLNTALAPYGPTGFSLSPSELAIQLVKSAEEVTFSNSTYQKTQHEQ